MMNESYKNSSWMSSNLGCEGLPMSPEDVHIRVLRLGHAIQVGL